MSFLKCLLWFFLTSVKCEKCWTTKQIRPPFKSSNGVLIYKLIFSCLFNVCRDPLTSLLLVYHLSVQLTVSPSIHSAIHTPSLPTIGIIRNPSKNINSRVGPCLSSIYVVYLGNRWRKSNRLIFMMTANNIFWHWQLCVK